MRAGFEEIQERDILLEEKLELQHKAILNFLKDKSLVESQNTINKEITKKLKPSKNIQLEANTLQFLASAEYVWQNAALNLDYSMAITEFGKAVEYTANIILDKFKTANSTYSFLNIEKIDLVDKCTLLEKNKEEGRLKHQLNLNRIPDGDFLNHFNSYCSNHFIDISSLRRSLILSLNPSCLLDKNNILYANQTILILIREVRNSAAHPNGLRNQAEAQEYRQLVLDFFVFWCNNFK